MCSGSIQLMEHGYEKKSQSTLAQTPGTNSTSQKGRRTANDQEGKTRLQSQERKKNRLGKSGNSAKLGARIRASSHVLLLASLRLRRSKWQSRPLVRDLRKVLKKFPYRTEFTWDILNPMECRVLRSNKMRRHSQQFGNMLAARGLC